MTHEEIEERRKTRRENLNLAIALFALVASLYSVLITHLDSIENLHRTQRAYVGVETDKKSYVLRVGGSSPANHVTLYGDMKAIPLTSSVPPRVPSENEIAAWQHAIDHEPFPEIKDALFLAGTVQQIAPIPEDYSQKDMTTKYVFGVIRYRDIFNIQHTTHFCFHQDMPCQTGNDAD